MELIMSMFAEFLPLLDPKFLKQIFRLLCGELRSTALGRFFSGLVVLLVALDGLVRLTIRPIVAKAMDHIGDGSSDTMALSLGLISLVCMVLYAVSPISIISAYLLAGYLGAALAAHVRTPSPLSTQILFGIWFVLLVWGGLWWRGRNVQSLPRLWRWGCCTEN
jgi:DoxX-like family